jgi:uncharacterized protein (DUF2225 family)
MKFECLNPDCKKTFMYSGRLTKNDVSIGMNTAPVTKFFEVNVCPYCQTLDFQEHVESMPVEKIVSVKSVELDKVDEWIGQGYEVKELYAKTATMIKKEAKP